MSRHRVSALLAVFVMTAALVPAAARAVGDPVAGIQATWSVTRPDSSVRTDDAIAVGDDLFLSFAAVDSTPVTSCYLWIFAIGGGQMLTQGAVVEGACELTVRLPDFPDKVARDRYPADSAALDLCVLPISFAFEDGASRTLRVQDHLAPGGRNCNDGGASAFPAKLDFPVDAGGTPRAFASDPQMLSWNPDDWGTGMERLVFGSTWHFELPDWVEWCWPYLNGEWTTVLRGENVTGCQAWNVRMPGVLPSTVDWAGAGGTWAWDLVTGYQQSPVGPYSRTVSAQRTAMAASDEVFESDRKAVFPVDLASSRFVTVGDRWTPVFQVTGGMPETCTMTMYSSPLTEGGPNVEEHFVGVLDAEARCSFDIRPMEADEYHQFYVNLSWGEIATNGDVTYGAMINAIPLPAPPIIDPPVSEPGGDTGIGVDPGAGNGLLVDLAVMPAESGLSAAAAAPVCIDREISTNLETGGAIPRLDALCDLAPGNYVATATMVDASGRTSTSTRSFTVLMPPPLVATRSPAPYATGVARNVHPTVTFDRAVTGVSASTVRLRDLVTLAYIPATVSYDPAAHRATLRPSSLLTPGRSYRLYATAAIKNLDGVPMAATSTTFRVSTDATPPTYARSPGSNAIGVARTANIVLTFSEAIRGVSSKNIIVRDTLTGVTVPGVVTYDVLSHKATVNPSRTLIATHRYTVAVRFGMTDATGNPLALSSWTFTTGP